MAKHYQRAYETDPIVSVLRIERIRQGLSLKELAYAMGRQSPQTIWQWESGTNYPRLDNLRQWADALGFEVTIGRK